MQPRPNQNSHDEHHDHNIHDHDNHDHDNHDHDNHDHDHADHKERHDFGLAYDLGELNRRTVPQRIVSPVATIAGMVAGIDRRHLLKIVLVGGVAGIATLGFRRTAQAQSANVGCVDIPEETAGPFPGDGTNGPNVLSATGVVRSDITASFAGLTGIAAGVPLNITLTILDAITCAPAQGYAVYLWHADQLGRYSLYSAGASNQNYLRGVQETDPAGKVTFKSIFPGCYDGRWPHIHFEVYPSLAAAGDATQRIATSQLAMPKAACEQAYTANGYTASPANLAKVSLATDGVFRDDGGVHELPTMSGSVATGFTSALNVTVSNTVKASGGGPVGPGGGPGTPPPGTPPPGGRGGPPTTTAPTTTIASTTTIARRAIPTTTKKTTKRTVTTIKKKK